MSELTALPQWRALSDHARGMAGFNLRQAFDTDPGRAGRFSVELGDLFLDYSKNLITDETLKLLLALAEVRNVEGFRDRMFAGELINNTERRAVLHTALRYQGDEPLKLTRPDGSEEDVRAEVADVLGRMKAFTEDVRSGERRGSTGLPFTDVVNIGIGGSDLGPAMAVRALTPYTHDRLRFHFVSNVDPTHIAETVRQLDLATTLFIVVSKTFGTQETLANARVVRDLYLTTQLPRNALAKHVVAVSSEPKPVQDFGIELENMFEFWDWVGGRYSVWSAVGLSLAIAIGFDNFVQFHRGAHAMDKHFQTAPAGKNMPILLALLGVWYRNFMGAATHAVLPYDQYLARFPAYLQQADMESNGKRVDRNGVEVDYQTGPIIWGEPGTNGQHAFYQLIHQGTQLIPADLIACIKTHNPVANLHDLLLANCLAQGEALMTGKTTVEAGKDVTPTETAKLESLGMPADEIARMPNHRTFPGNRPTNTLLIHKLTPGNLGALIALYEHKIHVQGAIWGINSYDQWGVELGKKLAGRVHLDLQGVEPAGKHNSSTRGLIERIRKH
ncbi:MAG: glucose-6-phosphate isomerase [Armatimonadetes bacterium]|nr:glucose-6-phosphate isomerase [Armatimonadota bacterium]